MKTITLASTYNKKVPIQIYITLNIYSVDWDKEKIFKWKLIILVFILLLDLFCVMDILDDIVVRDMIAIKILLKRLLIILSKTIRTLLKTQK